MADPTKQAFSRIKELKCFRRVYEMLVNGYPTPAVARFIQEERGEYKDITYQSLVTTLGRYRNQELSAVEVLAPRMDHWIAKKGREFEDRLEELKRMETLYRVLEYRIDMMHAEERITGRIDKKLDRVIRETANILNMMHKTKMDLGISGSRDLGTMTISSDRLAEIEDKFGPEAAKTYANPVSRGRMLKALNLLIEKSNFVKEGNPIDVEFVEKTKDIPDDDMN